MWIDTAGTLPAGSQLTVAAQRPIIMPRPHRFMLHSPRPPTTGPDLLSLAIRPSPRGASRYLHPHPDRRGNPNFVQAIDILCHVHAIESNWDP
ncbi:hypothetical protein BASA60_009624 [Batrachochytrium salamandrivorans]|nr:hypothetical protein BASA60_009624 [Batrachochytrium salamandrivorans]